MRPHTPTERHDHEQVVRFTVGKARLTAIVAIHNTALGPALGGVRLWPYASENDALADVLNLSRDMTYKAAAAGLDLGGGKAVIRGAIDPDRRKEIFRAFGRCVDSLGGRYIAAEDVGTTVADIDAMRAETSHAVGSDPRRGGRGDPSPWTARGVLRGMEAALVHVHGAVAWDARRVAVQGAGKVGGALAELLVAAGAEVIVADVDDGKARQLRDALGVEICAPPAIYEQSCDVFAPCAMGGAIDAPRAGRLACRIVAGAANNQLADNALAQDLRGRGILYIPDFVINAGGLINVAGEHRGLDSASVRRGVDAIGDRVGEILARAERASETPWEIARRDVRERISRGAKKCPN